jgi:hypothetical protein
MCVGLPAGEGRTVPPAEAMITLQTKTGDVS